LIENTRYTSDRLSIYSRQQVISSVLMSAPNMDNNRCQFAITTIEVGTAIAFSPEKAGKNLAMR